MKVIKINLSLFLLLILFASQVYSQKAPGIKTQKCFGGSGADYANSLIRTSDGGYAFAGTTDSSDGDVVDSHGAADFWVVKLNADGVIQWSKCYGGSKDDYAESLIQTKDGGYVVAGLTKSFDGDVVGNHGITDAWVIKIDSAGKLEWHKCLGGTSYDFASSVIQNSSGGYTLIGTTRSIDENVPGNHGSSDMWVVSLSSSGSMLWQNCYGSSGYEGGYSVVQTHDGGYMLCGYTKPIKIDSTDGDVSGQHGNSDVWGVKIGSEGALQWQKCFGGSNDDGGTSLIAADDGGYVICGVTQSQDSDVSGNHSPLTYDAWIVKVNSLNKIEWQKCFGGVDQEIVESIIKTSDGGFAFIGYASSYDGDVVGLHFNGNNRDAWVVKLDSLGKLQWQRCIGGGSDDYGFSIVQNLDGTLAVLGRTISTDGDITGNHGGYDVLFLTLQNESGITDPSSITNTLALSAYPNPAVKNVTLGFQLASSYDVIVSVTDVTGNKVGEYAEAKAAGQNEITLDLGSYSEGTYYVTVTAGGEKAVTAVQVVR